MAVAYHVELVQRDAEKAIKDREEKLKAEAIEKFLNSVNRSSVKEGTIKEPKWMSLR